MPSSGSIVPYPLARAASAVDQDLARSPPKGNGRLKVALGVAAVLVLGVVGVVVSDGVSGGGVVESVLEATAPAATARVVPELVALLT